MLSVVKRIGLVISLGLFCFWAQSTSASEEIEIRVEAFKPKLLLLKTYEPSMNVVGWLMSEKLDGVRAYWDGRKLVSRNGQVFSAPKWFTKGFPKFELDGELWLGRTQFEKTVSIVRKAKPHEGWKRVSYQIFEVPNQQGDFLKRLGVLESHLSSTSAPYLHIIRQDRISSSKEVQNFLKKIIEQGGEGIVLREPNVKYHAGRSNQALKVKLKQDSECTVQGYTQGKGKYLGLVGALICHLQDGTFTGLSAQERIIKIGSGLNDSQRNNPPEVGTIVTFQYMGLTKKGLPRFPVFLRVRSDGSS